MSDESQKQSNDGWADEIIDGHSYDGIQEYDNPMPLWYSLVFAVTVIWSPIYIGALEFGFINKYEDNLSEEMKAGEEVKAAYAAKQPSLTPERIVAELNNKERVAAGQVVFKTNCSPCHLEGQGSIGPNLTDKFWLHGGDPQSIYNTIDKGVIEKGMVPWGPVLPPDDLLNVGAFVVSLRNTNMPGKAPEGEPYLAEGGDAAAEGGAAPAEADAAPEGDAPAEGGDAVEAGEGAEAAPDEAAAEQQ